MGVDGGLADQSATKSVQQYVAAQAKKKKPPKVKKGKKLAKVYYYYGGRSFTSAAARNRYAQQIKAQKAAAKKRARATQITAAARRRAAQAQANAKRRREQTLAQRLAQDSLMAQYRRRVEAEAAKRRRKAYEALKVRGRAALERLEIDQHRDKVTADRIKREKALAAKLEGGRQVKPTARIEKMGETVSDGELRRYMMLQEARRTRDYEKALKSIRNDQAATGGRHLNRDLYETLYAEWNRYQKQVDQRAADAYQKALKAFQAGKLEEQPELLKAYIDTQKEWRKVFGDGRKGGSAHRVASLLRDISRAQDEYMQRAIFGFADASTRTELNQARARMDVALTRTRRGGSLDEPGPRDTETYRITVADYLKELEAQERALMVDAQRRFVQRNRMFEQEGFEVTRSGTMVDKRGKALAPIIRKALGSDFEELLTNARTGNMVDRQRAVEEIIERTVAERRREVNKLLGVATDKSAAKAAADRLVAAFEQELTLHLTGRLKPEGIEGVLSAAVGAPVLGEALKGFALLGSGITGAIRWAQTDDYGKSGGRAQTLDINLEALTELGKPGGKALFTRDFHDEGAERAGEAQAKQEFARVIQEADGDFGKIMEAIIAYGGEPFQGNVGNFAAAAALDPTIALNFTKFLSAGRLAAVRAGGLGGALRNPGMSLADWYKLTLPKSAGGYGRSAFTLAQTLDDLGKIVGTQVKDISGLTPDVMQATLRSLLEHPRTVTEAKTFIEKQFKVTAANAAQILTSVQEYATKKGGALGLRAVSAREFEDALLKAESIVRTAPPEYARELRLLRRDEQAEALTTAAHLAREGRARSVGAPLPTRPKSRPIDPVKFQAAEAKRTAFQATLDKQIALAADVRKSLGMLKRHATPDARAAAYRELETKLDDYYTFLDRRAVDPTDPDSAIQTVIDRARVEYEEAVRDAKIHTRPRVAETRHVELVKDVAYVDDRIRHFRGLLKNAAPADVPGLRKDLRMLGYARRALTEARDRNQKQAKTAKEVVRRGTPLAETFVRRPRLVAKASTREGVVEEASRDLYRRFQNAEVEADPVLDPATRTAVEHEIGVLDKRLPVLTAGAFDDVRADLQGLSLWESIVALDSLVSAGPQNSFLARPLALLRGQAGRLLTQGVGLGDVVDAAKLLHGGDAGADWSMFKGLDARVQQSFRDHGIAKRRGQIRFYKQSKKAGTTGPVDSGIRQTVAKIKALRQTGVSMYAYDELHRALSATMLKEHASENLRRRARGVARSTGRPFDEVYEELYAQKLRREAAEALDEFAMRREFDGWLPDEILAAFEESQVRNDLRTGRPKMSGYVARSIQRAIGEQAGIDSKYVADRRFMARTLGGRLIAPDGMRLATPAEMAGVGAPVPVFVAPASHPEFASGRRGYYQRGWGIVLREDVAAAGQVTKTSLHEFGHAAIETARAGGHITVSAIDGYLAQLPLQQAWFTSKVSHPAEMAAELYALWAGKGVDLDFTDAVSGTSYVVRSWDDIRGLLGANDQLIFDRLGATFGMLPMPDATDFGVRGFNVPPLGSRQETYQWLQDNGFWAPRTAQRIREGGKVWSISQERDFFETSFGFTPPWADADLIRPVLDDPRAFADLMTQFGYLDNGFELHASALNLDADGLANAIAFGTHETQGIKRGRTRAELREWFAKRFEDLVVEEVPTAGGGKTRQFRSAPWLMDAGSAEYKSWVDRMIDEKLPINPTLITDAQRAKFKAAYKAAVDRRLERLAKRKGNTTEWLPEEQMRFAIDVTNELLMSREWRSFTERAPVGHRALRLVGELQRLLVVFQLAFPVMNLIDRFTIKQALLMVANSGYRFWHAVDQDAAETISDLRSINIRERGLWDLRTSSGWERMRDSELSRKTRALGILDAIKDVGYEVSSWGEDSLKLNFAQRVYAQIRDDLIAEGVEREAARTLALSQTRKRVTRFFPTLEDAGELERSLNQLVPFLSYNFRNQVLGLKIVAGHPWLWNLQNHLGALIEESNRSAWEEEHPGLPLPDKFARRLLVRSDGETFAIDLANFSDWFRGPERFQSDTKRPETVGEWVRTFFRVPHPVQQEFIAVLTGGTTPWGTPARFSDFLPFADFLPELFGESEVSGLNPIQFWSKQLFFSAFAKVDPTEARASLYFDLVRAGQRAKANRLLDVYPDVEMWLQAHTDPGRWRGRDAIDPSWFRGRTRDQVKAYEAAKAGLDALRRTYDIEIAKLWDRPWSDEYRAIKKESRAAILAYMLEHRELIDARTISMGWDEWLEEVGEWAVDDMVDEFFRLDRMNKPERTNFSSELDYQKAQREYLDWRELWLSGNKTVATALERTRNQMEKAWSDQEDHWREIIRGQVDVRIRLLEEEAKGAKADRELVETLYDLLDASYDRLDKEAFAQLYETYDSTTNRVVGRGEALLNAVAGAFELPGRADLFFDIADERERLKIVKNEKYVAGVKMVLAKYGKDFYGGLAKEGLLEEYLLRNPEKRGAYRRYLNGKRYYNGIQSIFARAKSGQDFYRLLKQDPWLWEQYFARKPEKAAAFKAGQAYFTSMKRWVRLLDAGAYEEARAYFDALPDWIKDRYYSKHPEKRRKAVGSSAYAAAMGEWVGLLKAGNYVAARSYFDSLPQAFRERYFENHPEQRARYGGDDRMLSAAQAYFAADQAHKAGILAKNPDFADWLREKGGDEEQRRGMILAAYRAIPKDEAWVKRVSRERYPEIFSQEALGERRLEKVAARLAENPELVDLYEVWVKAQYHAFNEQYKRSGTPPKPLEVERVRRWRERRRKRNARFSKSGHAPLK